MLYWYNKPYTKKIQLFSLVIVNQNVNNRPQKWVAGLVTPAFFAVIIKHVQGKLDKRATQ